ncbi:MAG: hypothetical protein UR67_C0005G0038 [candidate division CPR3 bacterium GW2011_GWF2_35_18]|uniref:Uncharacterized protein n=1 Tax=candidate division CPR3 bacterium GW2011_GWF2_35_18 TaxID=1618350 RepID=A0A0G0BJ77_UNCC3|nr:MAG: hypothetical protein UR67_C0005G0038 [candidate division CPR3 bacterium GW2011_GWF2_35_18]
MRMNSMKNLSKKAGLILAQVVTVFSIAATQIYAATISQPISSATLTVGGVVNLIVKIVFGVGILICVIFLVFYGIKYITAGDDVKAIEGARKGITGAIIGLIVILLTFAIIKLVATFLGVNGGDIFSILPDSYSF